MSPDRARWLQAAGCRLLAAGCWLLAAGCWLLAAGTAAQRSAARQRTYIRFYHLLVLYEVCAIRVRGREETKDRSLARRGLI